MMPRIQEAFPEATLRYIGRGASASPATGSPRVHREQQQAIVDQALGD
jgi:2-oxoglutarate dehydrogenase E1 component